MSNTLKKCVSSYCFGIDVGGTTIKAGLFTGQGELLEKQKFATRKEENGQFILDDIAAFINETIIKCKFNKEQVLGIGVGVPGSVSDKGIVNKCINLGWDVVDVPQILGEKTGLRVKTGNDANMAALGEYWKGGASGYTSTLFVTLGTGVGGGIIINGTPLNGYNGAAAEIGHMPVVFDETEKCRCGKIGCLEQVASATGIVRTAQRLLKNSDTPSKLRGVENVTSKDIVEYAKEGDIMALDIIEHVSKYLGIALASASVTVDTQSIIIGGGVSAAGQFLIDKISKYYKEHVFHPCRDTAILLAQLGNDAGIYGAARMIIGAEI